MTAYTLHGLPCQTGSDAPCDAPDVWCDFADGLEALFAANDQIIGRYSPAVPAAKISVESNLDVVVNAFAVARAVGFEAVDIDTDNMVDFSVSSFSIKPRRFGTYVVSAIAGITTNDVDNMTLTITNGPVVVSEFGASYTTVASQLNRRSDTSGYITSLTAHLSWSPGDTVGFGMVLNPTDTGSYVQEWATLAAYWISDVEVFG